MIFLIEFINIYNYNRGGNNYEERTYSNIAERTGKTRETIRVNLRKLEEMGIQDGDVVSIDDLEFEYQR